MKFLRTSFAVGAALLISATAALAQNNTVRNHAFAIGKGPGVSGFTSLLCSSGQIAIGSAADPVCTTLSGDATMSAAGVVALATVNANVGTFGSSTNCLTVTVDGKGRITAASQVACVGGGITQLTGDVTAGPGSGSQAAALAASGVGAGGPTGSATVAPIITYDAKGRLTAVTSATITPAIGSVTGLGTGIPAALAIAPGSAGAPVLFNGAGGTPSSITLTNGTGLPTTGLTGTLQAAQEPAHTGGVTNSAGSLALTVITNANLTGDVTSAGNATTLTNAPVIAKVLTGYSAGAGTVASTDSILQGFNKIGGLVDNAAWSTFTPTPTCGTGAGTWTVNTAKQKTIGKTVHWQIDATLSVVGTCTGASWKFNLPSVPASGGGGAGGETAVAGFNVVCVASSGSAVNTCAIGGTIGVSNRFVASGVYEGP